MNIPSLMRSLRKKFFGGATPRRKPFRRSERPWVEALETREVPAVIPPRIIQVTPPNLSTSGQTNPPITIQFSEAMDQNDVTNVSNYLMFNSEGQPVSITQATYNAGTNTVSLTYSPGAILPVDAYSLFVKGDQIREATDTYTLVNPGQLVTTNAGPSTVSTINVENDGTLDAIASFPIGASVAVSPTPPPLIVATGDFNGDRINDVAILNTRKDTIQIFGGLGGGQFATTPDLTLNAPAGTNATAFIAFDEQTNSFFSGAVGPDLALTDTAGGKVVVFKNTSQLFGTINFGAATAYAAGTRPAGLVAADLDGDGNNDLAVVDTTLDTSGTGANKRSDWEFDILGGKGDGTFNAAVALTVGTQQEPSVPHSTLGLQNPSGIAAGNLRNGLSLGAEADLAITGKNGVIALINTTASAGKFSFTGAYPPPAPTAGPFLTPMGTGGYNSVQIGQIAHASGTNTVSDIVVSTQAGQITVFPNTGAGAAFGAPVTVTLGQAVPGFVLSPLGAIVGGKPTGATDILVATPGTNSFTEIPNLSPGTGAVTLGAPVSYRVDNGPVSLAVADMDGDNLPDVITANTGETAQAGAPNGTGQSFSIARGKGNGTFKVATTVQQAIASKPVSVAVGDVNGDGIPDYVVANSGTDQVEVYLGQITGGAGSPVTYAAPVIYSVVDQNGNGHTPVSVTLANLTGTFNANGLPVLDIVTADNQDSFVSILPNQGNGTFGPATTVAVGHGPTQVIAGLFNAVGGKLAQDLIVAHNGIGNTTNNQGVTVLINANAGNRTFKPAVEYGAGKHATAVVAGDFNNDGILDFAFTDAPTTGVGSVIVMEGVAQTGNPGVGSGTFIQAGAPFPVGPKPTSLAAADVNRDGYLDIIVGSGDSNSPDKAVGVLLSTVGDGFQPAIYSSLPGGASVQSLTVTDLGELKNDPYPDLVVSVVPAPSTATTPFVNNYISLTGVGDGHFINPQSYEAGGPPSSVVGLPVTSPIVTVSDPFLNVLTFFKGGNIVAPNLITNGNFESRDFSGEQGNLVGWKTANITDSRGEWLTQTGSTSPLSSTTVPGPDGSYQAMLDQSNLVPLIPNGGFGGGGFGTTSYIDNNPISSYSGSNFLYQDIAIPANTPTIQFLTLTGGTPGTTQFTLSLNGSTTAPITYTGTVNDAVNIQNALNNLASVTSQQGNVTVIQRSTGSWSITFGGGLTPFDEKMTAAVTAGPGSTTVETTQHGSGILSATLSLTLYLNNQTIDAFGDLIPGSWASGPASPTTTLDYRTTLPDQQVRVDLINPDAPISDDTLYNAATNTGTVYQSIYATDQSTKPETTITLSGIDVSALAGKRVRLRIAAVNNQGPLIVGVDDAALNIEFSDSTSPAFAGPTLRNPGFVTGPNNTPNTDDPTLIGQVNPNGVDGGVANVAFVAFDPNYNQPGHKNFTGPNVVKTNFFDALGHYSVTLSNLPFGLNTVGVEVQDKAGNDIVTTITFFNQGPSVSQWQAVGPGAINTTADPTVNYGTVSGRVTATATDPSDLTGNTYYVGSANGGVWKTTDGGADWTPLTDFIANQNGQPINIPVGAIAVAKTNPVNQKVVYVGTGDGDVLPDSRGGVGVLISRDGGTTWQVAGNSTTVLAGARISAMAVDPNTAGTVYVAVAAGGQFGPGVYKSSDFGATWFNVTNYQTMNLGNITLPNGTQISLPGGTALASVTSLIIDPRNSNDIVIGMGNIGLLPGSPTAGVWKSANFGATWVPILGGDDKNIPNNTVPTDLANDGVNNPFKVGRVTVAQGYGIGSDIATFYALVANPPTPYPTQFPVQPKGGSVNYGTGLQGANLAAGLYKTSDGGLNWTKVMIKANVGGDVVPANSGFPQINFQDVNLLGNNASNVGSLVIDPTNPNVVYVGGADNSLQFFGGDDSIQSPGLMRVDTGDMMDAVLAKKLGYATYNGFGYGSLVVNGFNSDLNNGDDIYKYVASLVVANTSTFKKSSGQYPTLPSDLGVTYVGEGVSWYDMVAEEYEPTFSTIGASNIPGQVESFTVDPLGRLLVGTSQGVYRVQDLGIGYDFSSGLNWFWGTGTGILTDVPSGVTDPPAATISVTPINGNLQIANLTSVATDPLIAGQFYTAGYDTGTQSTGPGGLSVGWQTMGLQNGIGLYDPPIPSPFPFGGQFNNTAGTVLTSPFDPSAPAGSLTTVYANYSYIVSGRGFDPQVSTLGGAVGTFNAIKTNNAGISINDNAGFLPVMVIDPVKVLDSGVYQDILAFGTDRIYTTRTSSNLWDDRVGHPLSKNGGYVTAIAIAPTNKDDNNQVFYVGSNLGEVWVDLHNGKDGWPLLNAGLPAAPVTSITVSPQNPQIAYVTFGGSGSYSHLWETINAGRSWFSIQGNLPMVPTYSFVTDPRPQPQAGAPIGHLYVGTEVGVFVSVDGGKSWQRLGQGLPNVPVVAMQFNQKLEELVVGTQGRGAFEISTDRVGAHVVSVTPATPVHAGLSSVTVTFNKPMADDAASLANFLKQVSILAPGGVAITPLSVTDVSVPPPGGSNPHNAFQITFAPLTADGVYTIKIGPNVLDQLGNPMDQNQNSINGEAPGDVFTFNVVVNTSDDGAFVSGLFNDLLNRPADTNTFQQLLAPIDTARFNLLAGIANGYVESTAARTQLIQDLYQSANTPLSPLGIGNLLGRPATTGPGSEVSTWLNLLNSGAVSTEVMIGTLIASDEYFNQTNAGHNVAGLDANFVNQIYLDLFGRTPSSSESNLFTGQLANAEGSSRYQQAVALVNSIAYIDNYVSGGYQLYLGRSPQPNETLFWEGALRGGMTQQQFIASLMGSSAYFAYAPTIITPAGDPVPPASNTTFIQAVYQQLFNGVPGKNTASDGEVSYWLGQLAGGLSRQQMVQQLLAGTRYLDVFIGNTYQAILGRAPQASEQATWERLLGSGFTQQNMLASLLASQEFFNNQGGGGTPLVTQDTNWITALYNDAIGRAPFSNEVTNTLKALDTAERNARYGVSQQLMSAGEYKRHLTTTVYTDLLGRSPTGNEVNFWSGVIGAMPAGPGGLTGDERLLAGVMSSAEYFNLQTDPMNGLHDNLSWVESLYTNLGLPVDMAASTKVVNNLLAAYQPQRAAAVAFIVNSAEYRTDIVTQDFKTYLRRSPTPTEINAWLGQFAAGVTREKEIAALMSTNEYFQHAPANLHVGALPSNMTFVELVYADLFPYYNASSGEINFWTNQLNAGQISRYQVALDLVSGNRYLFQVVDSQHGLVNALYNRFLGRNVTAPEVSYWQSVYASGGRDENVYIALMATSTYFLEPHPFP